MNEKSNNGRLFWKNNFFGLFNIRACLYNTPVISYVGEIKLQKSLMCVKLTFPKFATAFKTALCTMS